MTYEILFVAVVLMVVAYFGDGGDDDDAHFAVAVVANAYQASPIAYLVFPSDADTYLYLYPSFPY